MALSRLTTAAVVFAALSLGSSCAELPKDQKGTVDHIQLSGIVRVGLIENPPWVIRTAGEPAGAEVDLMREFAAEQDARPEWYWGGEEKLLGALEKFELDAVAGGLSEQTPWSARVGLTRYYFEEKFDVGTRPGDTAFNGLKGRQIAVTDTRLAGILREKGADPVPVAVAEEHGKRPLAAADWELARLGLTPANQNLLKDRHVVAVPPGENQLVKRLEEFLSRRHDRIPSMLGRQPEVSRR